MAEETTYRDADPIKVKLIKGQKDTYGWEISIKGNNFESVLMDVREVDTNLREEYKDKLGGA